RKKAQRSSISSNMRPEDRLPQVATGALQRFAWCLASSCGRLLSPLRSGSEIGCDIPDLLVTQPGGDRGHDRGIDRIRPHARTEELELRHDVFRRKPAETGKLAGCADRMAGAAGRNVVTAHT